MSGMSMIHHQLHTHLAEQLHGGGDVIQMRHIANDDRAVGQQSGRQNRQHRVFGAGDANGTVERRTSAGYDDFCHVNR